MMLNVETVERHLAAARETGTPRRLLDVHAHPFEFFIDQPAYAADAACPGVYVAGGGSGYTRPEQGKLTLSDDGEFRLRDDVLRGWRIRMLRQKYRCVGPKVFTDQMDLCGIEGVVLHPVLPPGDPGDEAMNRFTAIYGEGGRLLPSYCVPDAVASDAVAAVVRKAVSDHHIRAVKVHPNRSRIDLGSAAGVARVEAILAACDSAALPLLVHGGRSMLLEDSGSAAFATIDKLARVDWGISAHPVIIAHAGAFDCALPEAESSVLPVAGRLLDRHANLWVDTSGLGFDLLRLVVGGLDRDRVLFGSDALYSSVWGQVALVMHAFETLGLQPQEEFDRIAGVNPARVFAEKRKAGP
ncbi:MAG: amidohydrolase [Acidobacteriia bacterium]|nr:amidohydrolase [Terriglobia bacterium]